MSTERVVGVVLAGGQSRRMGEAKAGLWIAGEPLLRRVVRRLRLALPDVVVVGPRALTSLAPDARVLPDRLRDRGPLGGLVTALAAAAGASVLLVAVDMPFVEPALARAVVAQAASAPDADAVAIRSARGVEPLYALYRSGCLASAEALLRGNDRALETLLRQVRLEALDWPSVAALDARGLAFCNANTPEEWRHALELAGETLADGGSAGCAAPG